MSTKPHSNNKLDEFITSLENISNDMKHNETSSWFCIDAKKARQEYREDFETLSLSKWIAEAKGCIDVSEVEQYLVECELGEVTNNVFKAFTETNCFRNKHVIGDHTKNKDGTEFMLSTFTMYSTWVYLGNVDHILYKNPRAQLKDSNRTTDTKRDSIIES